jgi:hypothetical protein
MAEIYQYIDQTGTIVPDTSEILTDIQNEFKAAFGSDLDVTPSTPQGLLITAEALARDAVVRNNAALANQINPNIAGGIFLDAVCALTALVRDPATRSTVTATLTGVNGTVIPEGARAQTINNDLFESTQTVTISGGTATAIFQSVEFGAISSGIGDLNQIVDSIIGWETITNAAAATLGTEEQTDQSLRALRKLTLAIQGVGLPEAIISALYIVPGVKSLTFRENTAATTQTIDDVSMIAHSVYACIDGGTDTDVATALLQNKSLGAGWNGAVTVNVTEPISGQVYAVKFDRPTLVPILVRAWVRSDSLLLDPITSTKDAIIAYANGELEGEAGLVVGADVSSFELAGAVNRTAPGIYVQKLETSDDAGVTWSSNEIAIAISEKATIAITDITVTVI